MLKAKNVSLAVTKLTNKDHDGFYTCLSLHHPCFAKLGIALHALLGFDLHRSAMLGLTLLGIAMLWGKLKHQIA